MKRIPLIEILFVIITVITGINLQLNWFTHLYNPSNFKDITDFAHGQAWQYNHMNIRLITSALIMPLVIYALRYILQYILSKFLMFRDCIHLYKRYDAISYYSLLFTSIGFVGLKQSLFFIFLFFFIVQAFLIFKMYTEYNQVDMNTGKIKNNRLFVLFFISGFAALIYQVVWQRALFCFFGVNIESVTVIVSVFMFGLGLGALIGGYLSKKIPGKLPLLFVMCEALIGVFGFFSLHLFALLTSLTLHSSQLVIVLTVYGVLAFPTICMGATLPILVEYFHKTIHKVGKTVSFLYFINTLGSALASFFTVQVLFIYFGMQFSSVFASLCNLTVALLGIRFISNYNILKQDEPNEQIEKLSNQDIKKRRRKFYMILILTAITGYISMSQEILWIRFLSFVTAGKADVFAKLVGCILIGIALGSAGASWVCDKFKDRLMAVIAICLLSASLIYFVCIPMLSHYITKWDVNNVVNYIYICSGIIAFFMGISLPVLSHYAIYSSKGVGLSVSWIYFANIVGSTIGPILTGFFLLEWMSFEKNVLLLSALTWTLGVILWLTNLNSYSFKKIYKPVLALSCLLGFFYYSQLYNHIFEKLLFKNDYNSQEFKYIVQNKSGVITVEDRGGNNIIYGGGVYDGGFNISLKTNFNNIDRAYMVAAIKEKPSEVLEIGLSSGSWTKILSCNKGIKSIDVVEINPGYLELIAKYPEHQSILTDEKVKIHIDDGRRWLSRTDKKFDFILMNTTWYWRSQINNLVSKEFLQLCKQHLKTGGVLYYNTTFSEDIPYTTAHVFNYVSTYSNFVLGSDSPILADKRLKRQNLLEFFYHDKVVFEEQDSTMNDLLNKLSEYNFVNKKDELLKMSDRNLITDDNLASEFKTTNKPFLKSLAWHKLF